jgi:HD-GYP domain-containing protein (c-di-GMP phosphodiesterase class II)
MRVVGAAVLPVRRIASILGMAPEGEKGIVTAAIDRLREIPFFAEIAEVDLRHIAAIIAEKHYRAGEVIIKERTEAERFLIIHRGKIEITKKFEESEEFVLAVRGDGDFFGEMALLDEQPRSASARALEATTVLEISRSDFETLLFKAPALAFRIMKELSARLRETGALLISHLQQRNRQLYRSHIDTITMVVKAIEKRDEWTDGHTIKVVAVANAIGKEMGMTEDELLTLELSALLHDLGMLAVPQALITKPGTLTEEEAAEIRRHARKGGEMLEGSPLLSKAIPDVVHHQERFDGSGYPEGAKGKSIPRDARIIAVADAWEAMTRGRPYRPALSPDKALAEIRKGSGTQFDPEVTAAFEKLMQAGIISAG